MEGLGPGLGEGPKGLEGKGPVKGGGGRGGERAWGEYLDVIPKWPEPQCSHHYACACCRVGSSGYTLSLA